MPADSSALKPWIVSIRLVKEAGRKGMAARPSSAGAGDVEEAPLGVAQHQQAEQGDADQAGARLGADRDQQAGEDQAGGEQLHPPVGREDRAEAREPQDHRDQRDRDGRDGAALVEAAIVVDHQVEHAIAAADSAVLIPPTMMIDAADRIRNSSTASIRSLVRRVKGRKTAKTSAFHAQSHFSSASTGKSALSVVRPA